MLYLGIGAYKLGANYAPGVMVQKEAAKKGYVQNLWLHGPDHHITEVGTMNAFVVFKHSDGSKSTSMIIVSPQTHSFPSNLQQLSSLHHLSMV